MFDILQWTHSLISTLFTCHQTSTIACWEHLSCLKFQIIFDWLYLNSITFWHFVIYSFQWIYQQGYFPHELFEYLNYFLTSTDQRGRCETRGTAKLLMECLENTLLPFFKKIAPLYCCPSKSACAVFYRKYK